MKTLLIATAVHACCGINSPIIATSEIMSEFPIYSACKEVADSNSALDIKYGEKNINWWCLIEAGVPERKK